MNLWRLIFPKKDEEPEEVEIEEGEAESVPEPEPIELEAPKPNGFDARATAAEEALAQAMADLEEDDFEERVQSITMGTESLSQEQVQIILRNCKGMKSKPI